MATRRVSKKIASKSSSPTPGPRPPYDLEAMKAANRAHAWALYGRPIAPRFLPAELDQLNALRELLPSDVAPYAYRMSDAAVVKACFKYAVQHLDGETTGLVLSKQELDTLLVCVRLRREASAENDDTPLRGLVEIERKLRDNLKPKRGKK